MSNCIPSPSNFYSRPCGRGDIAAFWLSAFQRIFLLTPLREGRPVAVTAFVTRSPFLLTPLREGRRARAVGDLDGLCISTHAPAGGATPCTTCQLGCCCNFYSRPCGRGDRKNPPSTRIAVLISTHAPAGGATIMRYCCAALKEFLLTPLREGRLKQKNPALAAIFEFLLTPLREGRPWSAA